MSNLNEGTLDLELKETAGAGFTWSHALSGGGGFMMMQATVSTYFSVFMTDTFGIPAGILSMIVLFASLWDAFNDPMMGSLADYTNTKWGRYRPYFTIFPVLLTIAGYFLFLAPQGLSASGKVIYCSVFYVIFQMLVTVCTMPQMAILPAHVKNSEERNKIVMLGIIFVSLAFTIATSFYQQLSAYLGGVHNLMLVYGLFTVVPFWALFKFSKEKYLTSLENRSVKTDIIVLLKRKELFSVIIVWIMSSLGYGLMFAASVYYMLYFMVRPDLIGKYMLTLSVGATLSMMIAMPICLKLFKSAKKTFIITQSIAAVCYIVLFFIAKSNITLLFVLSFIATFFASMQMGLINILLNDVIDYIMLKDNISLNGTLSALKGFAFKLGGAIGNTLILQVLAFTGYIAGAVGHQPEATLVGINMMRFVAPVISAVIIILCLLKYPVEKYYGDIAKMKEKMSHN